MVIRCSLLGHDYGEPETVREREERGSEVVTTVREVEECGRCGRSNVVSENKEVIAIREPEPETADPADGSGMKSEPDAGAVIEDAEPGVAEEVAGYEADEDDGVILDDEEEADLDRSYGQWPEQEDADAAVDEDGAEADSPSPWPAVDEGADEGFDAESGGGEAAGVEFGGGLTPERAVPDEGEDAEYIEGTDDTGGESDAASFHGSPRDDPATGTEVGGSAPDDSGSDDAGFDDSGFTRSGSAPAPGQSQSDAATEFVCPECGHTQSSSGSSLRAGDICPECRRGYISEQER